MGIMRRERDEVIILADLTAAPERVETELSVAPESLDFDDFYRREFPGLVVLARVLAGPTLAEDIAQETMLVACRRWTAVREYDAPVGWLRTVCMHKAVSLVRRRGVEQRVLRQLGSFRAAEPSPVGEDEELWRRVRALPLRQAQAVALHYAVDLSVAEVAATLGCAEGTVKAHLARARTALAQALSTDEEGSA